MNTKYTPGPWEIGTGIVKTPINSGHKHIAMVNYYKSGSEPERSVYGEEHEANAQLIAAAPELLEALEEAVTWMETYVRVTSTPNVGPLAQDITKAHAAITKAKGAHP
jgi:hypothetical protein